MISFIKGTVSFISDSYIILNCNNMGFMISMPSTALFRLSEGMEVTVHTHLAVKEDDLSLYGFLDADDLSMFKQLITVSGVGPKGALGILSALSTQELRMAIAAGDAKLISGAKGIGLKTAQKLVVDLKGKVSKAIPVQMQSTGKLAGNDVETAIMFAEATGISRTQSMKALSKAELPDNADVDTIIDIIFKNLNV